MVPKEKKKIEQDKLILVEGKDEVNFFEKLTAELDIRAQIFDVGGVNKFPTENGFEAIKNLDGYESVKILAIVRDADNDLQAAFESVRNVLIKYKVPTPENIGEFVDNGKMKVGIYIMPDCENAGMLEDLCLKSVENKPVIKCVDGFVECVNSSVQESEKPTNIPKAKVQAYLSGMKDIVPSLGLGARKNYWDFNHECMNKIKTFLEKMR